MQTTQTTQPANKFNEKAVIADYLNPELSFTEIAERHGIPYKELLDWAERPEIMAMLKRIEEVDRTRALLLASSAMIRAIDATVRCLTSDKPETVRRAAAAILKLGLPTSKPKDQPAPSAANPSRSPAAASPASAPTGAAQKTTTPPTAATPTPSPQQTQVTPQAQSQALKPASQQHHHRVAA